MPKLSLPRLLVLGGTRDAVWLAEQLVDSAEVIYSLAGKTTDPMRPKGCGVRVGGFGGLDGLIAHLRQGQYSAVIDATHPFAVQISAHAVQATQQTKLRFFRYHRPPWQALPNDNWQSIADIDTLLHALEAQGNCALLTLGQRGLERFADFGAARLIFRMIHAPKPPHFLHDATCRHTILCQPPPYGFDFEQALFDKYGIDTLVTRNSGGLRPAKLDVAAKHGLPVLMLEDQFPREDSNHPAQFLSNILKIL